MTFIVKEHSGISPQKFERPFFLKHFTPYVFSSGLASGKTVLEIGFGDGYGSYYLSEYAKKLYSVDLFPKNTISAHNKYNRDNLRFIAMNGCELAFKSKIFDTIVAFQVIEHIPRTSHALFLREVIRVLKNNGIFILTTPNILNLIKNAKGYAKNPHHDLEFSYEMLKKLLREHFIEVEMCTIDYSVKQKFFLRLKKTGIFKYLPPYLNIVDHYFNVNIDKKDFVIRKSNVRKAPDLLAVCRHPVQG